MAITFFSPSHARRSSRALFSCAALAILALAVVVAIASRPAAAQDSPGVTSVDPASGKVNDSITVSGTSLGKGSISAVYLSDDKNDYKASIVEQEDTKIVMKVPQVKPGSYNVSIQKGNSIYIQPIRFTVQE
ncbi:MAG TPA: IPT/TIG domain-containing protein [Candidatus Acidoferrales bacterium]|nr:IPT/TIG domain-containing protein [Candidatus Acidoferrales bacterium]